MTLLVNFGGPRNENEVETFLTALFNDQDVIQTPLPAWLHRKIFTRTAVKRAHAVRMEYEIMGGKSPIYEDTEALANLLRPKLGSVYTFHRYLPSTHQESIEQICRHSGPLRVLPLFPQFSYATTGSVARFLSHHVKPMKLRWIKSYAAHPAFIRAYQEKIRSSIPFPEDDTLLIFSAHGVPISFIQNGDPYEAECHLSFQRVLDGFPQALGILTYQSKVGKAEWLRPSTEEVAESILSYNRGRKHVYIVPISFTSDHIETLVEIEHKYLPPIRKQGLKAARCPALNLEPYWVEALVEIAQDPHFSTTQMLVR